MRHVDLRFNGRGRSEVADIVDNSDDLAGAQLVSGESDVKDNASSDRLTVGEVPARELATDDHDGCRFGRVATVEPSSLDEPRLQCFEEPGANHVC